jgi:hypothetical protein
VAPNQGMVDTITAIMAEVLNILAIATKEIKQGRMSKFLLCESRYISLSKIFSLFPDDEGSLNLLGHTYLT